MFKSIKILNQFDINTEYEIELTDGTIHLITIPFPLKGDTSSYRGDGTLNQFLAVFSFLKKNNMNISANLFRYYNFLSSNGRGMSTRYLNIIVNAKSYDYDWVIDKEWINKNYPEYNYDEYFACIDRKCRRYFKVR